MNVINFGFHLLRGDRVLSANFSVMSMQCSVITRGGGHVEFVILSLVECNLAIASSNFVLFN